MKARHQPAVALSLAAQRLGISRERAARLVFCGVLDGEREANGRWLVSVRSIERTRKQLANSTFAYDRGHANGAKSGRHREVRLG